MHRYNTEKPARWEMFTKERAASTLDAAREAPSENRNVRTLRHDRVETLTIDMESGLFYDNGETIKFDKDGFLIDGQHRLEAIVRSGVSQVLLCVYNVTHQGVDVGAARTVADMLPEGCKNRKLRAAMIKSILQIERGKDPWAGEGQQKTNLEANLQAYKRSDIARFDEAVAAAIATQKIFTPSVVGAVHYLSTRGGDMSVASRFFRTAAAGVNLDASSPELLVRQWSERAASEKRSSGAPWSRAKFVVYARAWNAYVAGIPITRQGLTARLFDCDLPTVATCPHTDGASQ